MGQSWVKTETAGCDLGDERLNRCPRGATGQITADGVSGLVEHQGGLSFLF